MPTRRTFLASAAAAAQVPTDLTASIEHTVHWDNLDGRAMTMFHPRACRLPGGTLLMTIQGITGSDYFHPAHWTESRDGGRTWTREQPIPSMGRHPGPDGLDEGYCDTVPEYHAGSGAVLAMAHNVYYKDGKLARPNDQRWPVYVTRRDGRWGPVRKLEWNEPEASAIYTSNCSQRVTLADGSILVPLSFGPTGRADRAVCTVRCSFDGETMRIRERGNTLRCSVGRGLLEPSLATFGGVHWMTIRAENGQGFVTKSRDGLEWEPMRPWAFEDGEPIGMSTTQQRWLPHSDALHLVYTRRDASNAKVVRWRAPLWMARVDPRRMCLVRASERVVIPMNADGVSRAAEVEHQGNFHTTAVSADESIVTTGTVVPGSYRGAVRTARIRWSRPNGLAARV